MNFFVILSFYGLVFGQTGGAAGSNVQMQMSAKEAMQLALFQQQMQQKGCMEFLAEQINEGRSDVFETQQAAATNLANMSQKYFEFGRSCREEIANFRIKHEEAKLAHRQRANELTTKIKRAQSEFEWSILAVHDECQKRSEEQFLKLKESLTNDGAMTAEEGGPQAAFGFTDRVNATQPLLKQRCMADPQTVAKIQRLGEDLKINIEELQTNLRNSAESLATVSENLEFAQDNAARNCAEGEEQLDYQNALMQSSIASGADFVKKQNTTGLIVGGMNCIQQNGGGLLPIPSDATNTRAPTSM